MKYLLFMSIGINILFISSCSTAQSKRMTVTNLSSDIIPEEVKNSLQNLTPDEIENYEKGGTLKVEANKSEKYDLKIENNNLVGTIKSEETYAIINVKLIWHCDHNPQHIAMSTKEVKEDTEKYKCQNWSAN